MSILDFEADIAQEKVRSNASTHTKVTTEHGVSLALENDLGALKTLWCDFEKHAFATVFQYHGFLEAWMKHVGLAHNISPLIVTGRNQNNDLVFIMPFCVQSKGPFRILSWMGLEEANYQQGLFAPNFLRNLSADDFKTLWHDIKKLLPRFDCVFFSNQPEQFDGIDNPFMALGHAECSDNYYEFSLQDDYQELFHAKRSPKTRAKMRKRDRELDGLGEIIFTRESDPNQIKLAIAAVMAEKNRQLARLGRKEKFPEAVNNLLLDLINTVNGKKPIFELFTLRLDGELVAATINTTYGNVFSGIILFMFKGELKKHSPGDRLLRETIQWACEQGYKTYDLSLGRANYKDAWADKECKLFETLKAQNLMGMMYTMPRSCLCRIKARIKSSPAMTKFMLRAMAKTRK